MSKASGLPEWNELVQRIAEGLSSVGPVRALLSEKFDAISIATILRQHTQTEEEFAKLVRQALYREFDFKPTLSDRNRAAFASHVRKKNQTLHAVGTLCAVKKGTEYLPNSRIQAVITLNMDALLQMYTRSRFGKRIVRTVERASATASSKLINVYHVHGFMVREGTRSSGDLLAIEAPDRMIFTEQQYFDVVANANGFVNYSLLHLLQQHRFLFVGLSMTDTNLRRALHLCYRERLRELQAEKAKDPVLSAKRHWSLMKRSRPAVDKAKETLLSVVGVTAIWFNDWDDIPKLLRELYESTGDVWTAVA